MFEELVELCEGLGHKIIVREQGEKLWHVSVRGEDSTVAHAHGKSQEDAAAKVLELLKPKPKAVPKKRSKPAKIVATKEVEAEPEGDK
tara:strand:- start:1143 stop:1406 length:264 start_codon:yes stop_codon:yes gene_type:complete